jgi:hypothetical protein
MVSWYVWNQLIFLVYLGKTWLQLCTLTLGSYREASTMGWNWEKTGAAVPVGVMPEVGTPFASY